MREHPEVSVARDVEELAHGAAMKICGRIADTVSVRGTCSVALAGGETPRRVYQIMAEDPPRIAIPWDKVHLFFGDERMVSPDKPESNYGMAHRELVCHIRIPPENVHRILGEIDAAEAARRYDADLKHHFGGGLPRFDVVLLGVGEDGHTASLFPRTSALAEVSELAVSCFVPQLNVWRVTLTLPVFDNAREVFFLAAGKRKASVIAKIIAAGGPHRDLPASLIRPTQGRVEWMLDDDAASLLS